MAGNGIVCSVVHLSQHPPPVQIPQERVSLPNPIPSHHGHGARRTAREHHGGFRWHRPAFQPFQLKPWLKDPDVEEKLRESLAVIAPSAGGAAPLERGRNGGHYRSLTAPPATVSSLEGRRGVGGPERREPPRTANPGSVSLRELLNPVTKRSVATFPCRPPFARSKQIPGRFFPKPTLTEEQKAQLELFRRMKPRRSQASLTSPAHSAVNHASSHSNASAKPAALHHQVSSDGGGSTTNYNARIALTREKLNPRTETRGAEVFAICFKTDLDQVAAQAKDTSREGYDPGSELHSDYYSIKRLKVPLARLGRAAVRTSPDDFTTVLRGQRKQIHNKFFLSADDTESLVESLTQGVAARSGGSVTRRTLLDSERESPRRVIDIETPKADARDDDDDDDASTGQQQAQAEEEEEQDITLAPLNSPTGTETREGAFPALV